MNLAGAQVVAAKVIEHVASYCQRVEVAGSVRRGKPFVKDIELVAIAGKPLWDFLDSRLLAGTIQKATYPGKDGKTTYRWGPKYRGFVWAETRIEIFLADESNWGYLHWIRTGPDKANTAVMIAMSKKNAPFRFRDGYCYMQQPANVPAERRKISIPDEPMLFSLLGMPYIEPKHRTAWQYEKALYGAGHEWGVTTKQEMF